MEKRTSDVTEIASPEETALVEENTSTEKKSFWSKTAILGKKVVQGVQSGAKAITEHTQKSAYEKQLKKYNPLTPEQFKSEQFALPNVIEIVDDAVRRGIEVCEGAIGWTDSVNGVEILHLYDEWIKESTLQFIPFPKCDAVYCVDNFDRTRFINVDTIFERTTNEKIAELENIAYCLGAKSCSIEIIEQDTETKSARKSISSCAVSKNPTTERSFSSQEHAQQSGKNITYFDGNKTPYEPPLKWFAFDDNIKGLIAMKCGGNNAIKSKVLELSCTTSATMSQKAAGAIDKLLKVKVSMSMEKKAIKEHCSILIFEVKF